jgi:histidine triad (HIT) family protein
MGEDTIFGKITRGEIPTEFVYEDEHVVGFRDIHPQAPVHVLFVPRKPYATLNDVPEKDAALLGRLMLAASGYAKQQGFADRGYRVVMNVNRDGGQTVFHVHLHLLAGHSLREGFA